MRRYLFNANQVEISVIKTPKNNNDAMSIDKTCQEKVTSIVSKTLFNAKKEVIRKASAIIAAIQP